MEEGLKNLDKQAQVYAIVVTYNSAEWIEDCLKSLEKSEYPVKIIVVDNASSDETYEKVSRFPQVRCLPQKKNLGFGPGNNLGMSLALKEGAEYIFLLNPDASVRPDTIGKLVRFASEHSQFGVLAPFHLNGEGNEIEHNFADWLMQGREAFYSDLYFGRVKEMYSLPFMNAAAWLITRDCLEQVGGFDPLFSPAYFEDNDFCERLAYHGIGLGLVPSAVIHHFQGKNAYRKKDLISDLNNVSNTIKNSIVLKLKKPSQSFICQYLIWNAKCFCSGLKKLLLDRDLSGFVAILIAFFKVSTLMPRIFKHRQISLIKGPHWL